MWYKHGGEATVLAYEKVNSVTKQLHVDFFTLKIIISTKRTVVFVHAGFYQHGVTYEFFPKLFYWDRTLWKLHCL
jgi:serine/threonine protein phosphatase 1